MNLPRITKRAWVLRRYLAAKYRLGILQVRWQFCLSRVRELEQRYAVRFPVAF